ncbi:pyridoxamine 5'-phosphate oxidase [Flavobacterium sp.]|uniref:pyridoxamine 5'-phosphate oxidase n=1 Tax=Flavobacterium sp. TaxID=239 RepID=UPI00261FD52D|nr:pyridoxamine 5'-phosphate oxidase [Flavobacterium sp.]MDG2432476.1 pyridoxamine 5'-phosphate oxidase [Flavobacterium sp.]
MEDLSNYRKSYDKSELLESAIPADPIQLFKQWFQEVEQFGGTEEVNAMTVSTIGQDGFPRSRVVLLKKYTKEGFVFYTNYSSDKGKAIENNPNICISFFWHSMERQVIIKGIAEKVAGTDSDTYFKSRPVGSQLGAVVSNQSEVVPSRDFLEDKLHRLEQEYDGLLIPRPDHWGGYIVKPVEIEFWQGRANRLHDRIRFTTQNEIDWKTERLAP